jgi:hypothetical protein
MDEQLAAALAAKGFRRPIDVQQDYYAKGQPDGSEDYYIRVLTREESLSMLQELGVYVARQSDDIAPVQYFDLVGSGRVAKIVISFEPLQCATKITIDLAQPTGQSVIRVYALASGTSHQDQLVDVC